MSSEILFFILYRLLALVSLVTSLIIFISLFKVLGDKKIFIQRIVFSIILCLVAAFFWLLSGATFLFYADIIISIILSVCALIYLRVTA